MQISIFTKEGFASLGENSSEIVLDALTVNGKVETCQHITNELVGKIKALLTGNMTSSAEELLFLQLTNSIDTKMLIVDSKLESMLTIEGYLKMVDALNSKGVKNLHALIRPKKEDDGRSKTKD